MDSKRCYLIVYLFWYEPVFIYLKQKLSMFCVLYFRMIKIVLRNCKLSILKQSLRNSKMALRF